MVYINPRNTRFRTGSQGKTSFLTQGGVVISKGSSSSLPSRVRSHHHLLEANITADLPLPTSLWVWEAWERWFCLLLLIAWYMKPSHKVKSLTLKYKPVPVLWIEWPNVCYPEHPKSSLFTQLCYNTRLWHAAGFFHPFPFWGKHVYSEY